MTLSEFKAWFESFTEDMDDRPTAKQWGRIQARVSEITGQAVSYPVYIDRYVQPLRPYWDRVWCGGATGISSQPYNQLRGSGNMGRGGPTNAQFDSHSAMKTLGRADALALAR